MTLAHSRIPKAGLAALTLIVTVASCNVFSPIDSPGGDTQLLSAARAAFDRGDYATAMDYYQKLSASNADIANSEEAYAILDQNGAGFGTFASTIGSGAGGSGNIGVGFTKLAEALAPGAGQTKRLAIYTAYQKVATIKDSALKNMTQFLSASALAAEILGEAAATTGVLRKANLASGGSACTVASNACLLNASCDGPNPDAIPATNSNYDITTTPPSGTTPNLNQLYAAIKAALDGLNGLNPGGSFASTTSLLNALTAGGTEPNVVGARCFRAALLDQGIGE